MIDIDRFKAFNDTYGHPAGDRCLRLVGKCLSAAVKRPTDVIARYGGEEFVALLPDTTPEAANAVAEQFTLSLHRENIIHSECEFGELTASIGIATAQCRSLDGEPEYLLEAADDALYDAKKNGRNRIVSRRVAARALRSAGNREGAPTISVRSGSAVAAIEIPFQRYR
jgi:diguanylate cyclase (GGDEF)-like protein